MKKQTRTRRASHQRRVSAASVKHADKCIKLAKLILGSDAPADTIESQALAMMDMTDKDVVATYRRVRYAEQNDPNLGDVGAYPDTAPPSQDPDSHVDVDMVEESREGEEPVQAQTLATASNEQLEGELASRADDAAMEGDGMEMEADEMEEELPVEEEVGEEDLGMEMEDEAMEEELPESDEMDEMAGVEAADENDPASYSAQEDEVDVETVRANAMKIAKALKKMSRTAFTKKMYRLAAAIVNGLHPKYIKAGKENAPLMAEHAATLANALGALKTPTKKATAMARVAAEVADGMISPDTGDVDQDNEENEGYKPGDEATGTNVEKITKSKKRGRKSSAKPAASKKPTSKKPTRKGGADGAPAQTVPTGEDSHELTLEPDLADDSSTSEDLPGHQSKSSARRRVVSAEEYMEESDEMEMEMPVEEEVPAEEEVAEEEGLDMEMEMEGEEVPAEGDEEELDLEVEADSEIVAEEGEEEEGGEEEEPAEEEEGDDEEVEASDADIDLSSADIGLDTELSDEGADDFEVEASEDEVLDILFEQDEDVASEKLATLSKKTAKKKTKTSGKTKTASRKRGATKLGAGSRRTKTASRKKSETEVLESCFSSKPDVSRHFR